MIGILDQRLAGVNGAQVRIKVTRLGQPTPVVSYVISPRFELRLSKVPISAFWTSQSGHFPAPSKLVSLYRGWDLLAQPAADL
jgi:hypothetical protein